MPEFSASFSDCDALYLVDIYPAGETPIEGVHASRLAERIREASCPEARYFPSFEEAVFAIARAVGDGDVVLTLGAGNVWQAGDKLLALLEKPAAVEAGVQP